MGNRQSLLEQISIYTPPLDDLVLKDPGNLFKIYRHKYKGYELMAHKITLNEEQQLPILIDNFKARYQHHYLVSTLFLACEDYSACGGYYETVVFYQRIFTNLSKIKDIPFQDVLHFYAVAFKGFQILYRRFGYFQIYEDMFHLGQDSKLKIWCNRDISKSQPESYLLDKNGSEEDMLRKIIFLISENTDPFTDRINLKEKLLRFGVKNFQMANQSLRQICRQYNLSVPQRLTCISSLPSEEVRLMLDLYSSNSNYFSATNTVSDLTTNTVAPLPVPISPTHSSTKLINNAPPHQSRIGGFMTPHFQQPLVPHVPITQQFAIPQPVYQINGFDYQKQQKRETELSMIHTFNRTPQMPESDHRKGIDLSLGKNKQRRPSWHSAKKLSESRSRSLQLQNSRNIVHQNSKKIYSLQKKPEIKVNFVNKNNGWVNPLSNGPNLVQRFDRTLHQQGVSQARQNYHVVQLHQTTKLNEPTKNRVVFTQSSTPQFLSQPKLSHQYSSNLNYTPILTNSILNQSSTQKSVQFLKKSGSFAQTINPTHHKNSSSNNVYAQPSKPTYQPLLHQFRQRRASSKQNGSNQHTFLKQQKKFPDQHVSTSLQKNASTPVFAKVQNEFSKAVQSPFQKVQNNFSSPVTPVAQIQNTSQPNKLYLQVPLNPSIVPQFNAHSASSRYLYSNKDLNDNIPDIRYKKMSSPKKTINKLFDTKMQELQSFNQSKFGTQNSLKQPYAQNSRVLEIIGREKKDSITSAFGDQEGIKKFDGIKDFTLQSKNQINFQTSYKFGDSFTDPKILEILRRPSSKALKTELNTIKKVSKTSKPIEFSQEYVKKPFISKEVREDMLKLDTWQIQGDKSKDFNGKNNFSNFQGFPSMSNLSEINKIDENILNEQKSNLVLSNKKNLDKKSRFSEQKVGSSKKNQNGISEFYNYDYQAPTYDYSFSSKRQIPIQDNEWRAKYATTTTNSFKEDSTMVQKTNDFRMVPQKPFNYLTGFNSNESLASLEFQLSQKLANKSGKDHIKESIGNSGQFSMLKNDSVEMSSPGISRKYNPKLDPEISKDLQRFRKQKQQVKSN